MESCLELLYAGHWPARLLDRLPGAREVRVVRETVRFSANGMPPLRIGFVSDLHIGPLTPQGLLEAVFDEVRRARPDILLLGGDYVYLDVTSDGLAVLRRLVESVPCPTKLAVMGNHDLWTEDHRIVATLQETGVRVLVNEAVRLPAPWHDVTLVGLDDPWTAECDGDVAFAGLDDDGPRIVLCHSPDGLLQLTDRRFDLFVCGHTHGGQIASPWGPIVVTKGQLTRRFSAGRDHMNGATVIVSRGVGTVELPFRLFAPPDALVVDCEPES